MALLALLVSAGVFAVFATPVATAQSTTNVTIKNYAYNPASFTVVIGVNNTVTWTNNDAVTHTVTSNNGTFGGTLPPGKTFTFTFTTAGTYAYHCSIHTYIKGTVIVLGAPSTSTSSTTATAVPEFPLGALAVAVFTALVLGSYLVVKARTSSSRQPL